MWHLQADLVKKYETFIEQVIQTEEVWFLAASDSNGYAVS